MARANTTPTSSWALLTSAVSTLTIEKVGTGLLKFNDVAADAASKDYGRSTPIGKEIAKTTAIPTYVKTTGSGWVVNVDDGAA